MAASGISPKEALKRFKKAMSGEPKSALVSRACGSVHSLKVLVAHGYATKDGGKHVWAKKELTLESAGKMREDIKKLEHEASLRGKEKANKKTLKKTKALPAVIKSDVPAVVPDPIPEMDENTTKGFNVFKDMVLEAGRAGGKEVAKNLLSQQNNLLIEAENKKEAYKMFFKHLLPDMISAG